MPEFRVVGVSMEELYDEEFREFAADACRRVRPPRVRQEEWDEFARRLSYLPVGEAAKQLKGAVDAARRRARRGDLAAPLPERAAERGRRRDRACSARPA